jgi:outer membrane protein OmpA-like peptidoglycan-associated protein
MLWHKQPAISAFNRVLQSMKHANLFCLTLTACAVALGGCASGVVDVPPPPSSLSAYDQTAGPRAPATLTIVRSPEEVTISGSLATDEEKLAFTQRAAELFGGQIISSGLAVDAQTRPSHWIDQVLGILHNMAILSEFSITVSDDDLTLTAMAASQEEADTYMRDAYSIIEGKLAVRNGFTIRTPEQSLQANLDASRTNGMQPAVMEFQAASKPVVDATLLGSDTPGFDEVPLARFEDGNTDEPLRVISREEVINPESDEPAFGAAMAAADSAATDGELSPGLNGYLKNVRFYGGSDKLTQRARASLDTLAEALRAKPDTRLAIMSYTSNAGKPWELKDKARMRAKSVVTYLARQGVALDRLQGYALGHVNGSGDQIVIQEIQ